MTVRAPDPVAIDDPGSVESVGFFGDSIVADLTAIGGRNNQVVPQLAELLIGDGQLNVVRVENFALPGQSVVADTGILEPAQSTLDSYVEQKLRENPDLVDLAVVAISSTDINLNASLPEPATTVELADQMIDVLGDVEASFDAAGIEVVFVPIFGINDTIFENLRCALQPSCPVAPDEEIESINAILWDSGVSMLFERFAELDSDQDGRTDRRWFDNVDARYPDDGVHPNAEGQSRYSRTVYRSLRDVLTRT